MTNCTCKKRSKNVQSRWTNWTHCFSLCPSKNMFICLLWIIKGANFKINNRVVKWLTIFQYHCVVMLLISREKATLKELLHFLLYYIPKIFSPLLKGFWNIASYMGDLFYFNSTRVYFKTATFDFYLSKY